MNKPDSSLPIPAILDARWALFARVAELGSLTQAANALNGPQSVISRQIGQLERQCGAKLFRRTGRGVVLTEFGEIVYRRIRALMLEADRLADDILTTSNIPIGEVHVGLLPSTVPTFAGRLFQAVQAQFPRVRLHLVEGSGAQLEEWLAGGRLDMALLLREGVVDDRDEPCLLTTTLDLIGPRDAPVLASGRIAFDALQSLPLILPAEPHVLRRRLDVLARERGVRLSVSVEADTIALQREIAAAGIGYAIVAAVSGTGVQDGRLGKARIVEPELMRSIVLGTTRHRPSTLATRSLHQLIRTLFSHPAPIR
ncbi:LysR family transcriptional regulator [Herbaspirillum sp. DW155]|uniref:LysR family transcriptional regulator n=1 Tax=Herbaspirillum sp. DW155 TaxID=3095609 RepID=UPI0030920FA9|nr:LysR family transcriptional regulator [Herbaspirillum sp. DW155]